MHSPLLSGYCRVSTDKGDQLNSLESQRRYFREYISLHPDWQLHDIYADEGITGTTTRKRKQFNRMMNDAYKNHFQMIITKEVSRFSRNILDTIACTRELKRLGIGVYFLSDGFCSLDPDAELRLSIMGSIAQEESRKTSTRVKWGQTRQMERGVVFGRSMLGFHIENGQITVEPEGAEIVKQIFYKYGIEKKGTTMIARELRAAGLKAHSGNPVWNESHILRILKNEKYVGDLVQKKTITPDYLTHEKKYNKGEEELVIIKNHHESIISRDLWDLVQCEIAKRRRCGNTSDQHSNRYIFSGKIICGECGARFVSRTKVRTDGTSYRRWGCYNAARYGRKKTDSCGNTLGCDVGKQLRDDLAVEMLEYAIRQMNTGFQSIADDIAQLAADAISAGEEMSDPPDKILRQINMISKKKTDAIDLFLSGMIKNEELQLMELRYDNELQLLTAQLSETENRATVNKTEMMENLKAKLNSIISCNEVSEAFLKPLPEYMIVHKNGIVELKLNKLPNIWKFQLHNSNRPTVHSSADPENHHTQERNI